MFDCGMSVVLIKNDDDDDDEPVFVLCSAGTSEAVPSPGMTA